MGNDAASYFILIPTMAISGRGRAWDYCAQACGRLTLSISFEPLSLEHYSSYMTSTMVRRDLHSGYYTGTYMARISEGLGHPLGHGLAAAVG
jgi:hypothetical protein